MKWILKIDGDKSFDVRKVYHPPFSKNTIKFTIIDSIGGNEDIFFRSLKSNKIEYSLSFCCFNDQNFLMAEYFIENPDFINFRIENFTIKVLMRYEEFHVKNDTKTSWIDRARKKINNALGYSK